MSFYYLTLVFIISGKHVLLFEIMSFVSLLYYPIAVRVWNCGHKRKAGDSSEFSLRSVHRWAVRKKKNKGAKIRSTGVTIKKPPETEASSPQGPGGKIPETKSQTPHSPNRRPSETRLLTPLSLFIWLTSA